jgi:hypothetical protein
MTNQAFAITREFVALMVVDAMLAGGITSLVVKELCA